MGMKTSHMDRRRVAWGLLAVAMVAALIVQSPTPSRAFAQEPGKPITHGFLACGGQTYIMNGAGEIIWRYKLGSRDGYVLPNGNIVLAVNKGGEYPGGAAIEVTRDGKESVIWKGTQSEINSVQPVGEGDAMTFVLTEAGPKPRLLEVDRGGKIIVEFPLECQNSNAHMETRMARKIADGTYLAPHLLDFAVKQYDATGKVIRVFDTAMEEGGKKLETWPFTAIRLPDGSTHVNLTHGNRAVRFDAAGKIIWQVTNDDLGEPLLADPCGSQVLPNGNVVIASYGQRDKNKPKLLEITPDKKVVWTFVNDKVPTVHNFQILDDAGNALPGLPMK